MTIRRVCPLVGAALFALSSTARAEGTNVPLDRVDPGAIKVNGVLTEWQQMVALRDRVSGSPGSGSDLAVRAGIAQDEQFLYVAADVTDDKLVRTASYGENEDRLIVTIAFPDERGGYSVSDLVIFAGDPGNVAGAAFLKGSGKISGATVVEAPQKGGLGVEAKIPWSALPHAAKVRCGLRGAIRYADSDGGPPKGVVGTAPDVPAGKLPFFPIDSEQSILDNFVKEKSPFGLPQVDVVADLTGDEMKERVLLWDHYLLVVGPHFRDGKEFFFSDVAPSKEMIPSLEVRDLTGDGKAEIVARRRRGSTSAWVESLDVFAFPGDRLDPIFRAEVGAQTEQGSITSRAKVEPKTIEIVVGSATGLSAANFKDDPESGQEPLLLPWGTVKSRTYTWDGAHFTKSKEDAKAAGEAGPKEKKPAAPPEPAQPPQARPPTADEMQEQVLALYKRDRKVGAKDKPRFDLAANVAEDDRNERILVFGKDLVLFGKGFLGGQGYVAVGLGMGDKDVASVITRDLDGDGKAEILVRGVLHVKPPKDLAKQIGADAAEREMLLVYSVKDGKLQRVFAAETGLAAGEKRVISTIAFLPGDKGTELELGPGHAIGWDEKSFPFDQSKTAQGGIEPLVLPWSDASFRFKWNGSAFAR